MKRAFQAAVAILLTIFLCHFAVAQDVLQQVPEDALVVVKVRNLQEVSQKAAKWGESMGLAQLDPGFADPLGKVMEETHIIKGVEKSGEFAFVFTDPQGGNPNNAMLLLVPAADYKEFLTNWENPQTEGDVSHVVFPQNSEDWYIANWGKYAAMAQNKDLLTKKPAGIKLQGLALKEATERDAVVYVNMPKVRVKAVPALQEARTKFMAAVEKGLAAQGEGQQMTPVMRVLINQYFNFAQRFLEDSQAVTFGVNLGDEGLTTTLMSDFLPESKLGQFTAGLKNTNEPLLSGLPDRKYFVFGGVGPIHHIYDDLIAPIADELDAVGPEGKDVAEAMRKSKDFLGATKKLSLGYVAPTGALGAESIIQGIAVFSGDAAKIHESWRQGMQGYEAIMKAMPQNAKMNMKFVVTPEAKKIDDVTLDTFKADVTVPPNDPAAAQINQMMALIYGPNGMGGAFGKVSDDACILVQGGSDDLIKEAVDAARANKDPLDESEAVKSVASHLPSERIMVEYIALDNIISAGVRYAQSFGAPINFQLPADLPPIGVTIASEGSAVRMDGFVPTQLIQSLVAAGMQTYMGMQGGPGGAAGPEGL